MDILYLGKSLRKLDIGKYFIMIIWRIVFLEGFPTWTRSTVTKSCIQKITELINKRVKGIVENVEKYLVSLEQAKGKCYDKNV